MLIRAGAKVDRRIATGPAAVTGRRRTCGDRPFAVARGADPNTVQADGETALMTAARSGSVAAVESLLANGAAVDASESARADRPDVGRRRRAHRRGRRSRKGRGRQRTFEQRIHPAAVCGARGALRRAVGALLDAARGSTIARGQLDRDCGRRRARAASRPISTRSCSPPATPTSSSRRFCWTAAPIPTRRRADGPRSIRCRGSARWARRAATIRRPRDPAT